MARQCEHLHGGNVNIQTTIFGSLELRGRSAEEVHTSRPDSWGLGHYPSWGFAFKLSLIH